MPFGFGDTTSRLARRAASGDRRAFRELYRALYPLVARYVRRRIRERADAEDIVARAFQRVVEKLDTFDPARGNAEAWALTITRNLVIDHHRARRATVPIDDVVGGLITVEGGPLQSLLDDEEAEFVRGLLETCDESVRRLISLRYGDGLRHREIASLEGISEAAVRQRLSRALKDIRKRASALAQEGAVDYVF